MIVVYTPAAERVECEGANRYRTDEHNNLEITAGTANQPTPVAVFAASFWERVTVENED